MKEKMHPRTYLLDIAPCLIPSPNELARAIPFFVQKSFLVQLLAIFYRSLERNLLAEAWIYVGQRFRRENGRRPRDHVACFSDRRPPRSHRFPTIQLQLELTYSDLLFNI